MTESPAAAIAASAWPMFSQLELKATKAMTIKKMMATGPIDPSSLTMRFIPNSALANAMAAMMALPANWGSPKYWLNVAPAPEIMMMPTRKQNRMVNHSKKVPIYLPQKNLNDEKSADFACL